MKKELSKTEAQEEIDAFFANGGEFSKEGARKIKCLAMKYNLKLGEYRKKFCRKCFSFLKGKTRVTKAHKIIECVKCKTVNRQRIRFK